MDELFGLSMNWIMVGLLALLLPSLAAIAILGWRNPVMLKLGLRNIPRRKTQTALIIVGIMISTLIMAAAFGTGDTIKFSIKAQAIDALGPIDEIVVFSRTTAQDSFGSSPYFPYSRFQALEADFRDLEIIDGLAAGIGEEVPAVNMRNFRGEGRMRVAGVDPTSLTALGSIWSSTGEEVNFDKFGPGEAFINQKAADELDAIAGDSLRLVIDGDTEILQVKEVVAKGGLAGDQPTVILPLDRVQAMFDRPGQVNSIVVSNLGDETSGADFSDEVTRLLRVYFADKDVAGDLGNLLSQPEALSAMEKFGLEQGGDSAQELLSIIAFLQAGTLDDELLVLLANEDVAEDVVAALNRDGLDVLAREADTLFSSLGEFQVIDIKHQVLEVADEAASQVTTIFIVLGLFSILVGVLLIFLIFVMLAAARRSEMGMARAVGATRRHLVEMFVFEGTAYAVVSAAVGVGVGLGVSAIIVLVANQFIQSFDEDLTFTHHFEARSAIVAYCLGMVITLGTVAFSANRVSRMNIVVAIRGLPEIPATQESGRLLHRGLGVGRSVVRPVMFGATGLRSVFALRASGAAGNFALMLVWVIVFPIWIADIIAAVVRLAWPYFLQGWLALILGLFLTWVGTASDQAGPFRIGVSLAILGIGLMARNLLRRTPMLEETADRLAFTATGVLLVAFWVLPFSSLRRVAGELDGGPEMFFISGVAMVAATVWTVMNNSDLLLKGMTAIFGRSGRLRPVVITAVAYPMSAKFRTGLTLAMFALVIFTLIVVSILTEAFGTSSENIDLATGNWDIESEVNTTTPIFDVRSAIENSELLSLSDFEAIGGYTAVPIEARQVGAKDGRWRFYAARAANDEFFDATGHRLKLIADGYGPTEADVWQALKENPRLAVVDISVVATRGGFDDGLVEFQLEGLHYEDDSMWPIDIEVRDPLTGSIFQTTVIGVLDIQTDNFGNMGLGMFTSKTNLDNALPFPVPITTYRFRVAEGADVDRIARDLDVTFRENGLESDELRKVLEDQRAASRAFNNLFTGYMGMGLMVGIAALGVISFRAVVERRQQIGVLRAIGYRRRMIQLSFLMESSFIALLGIAIGVGLGTILSYNIVNDIRENVETIRFKIPWIQIGIIVGIAYVFSLLTTFLPARQASRIYPAEALRYE